MKGDALEFVVTNDPDLDFDLVQEVWAGDRLVADLRKLPSGWTTTFYEGASVPFERLQSIERAFAKFIEENDQELALVSEDGRFSFSVAPGATVRVGRGRDCDFVIDVGTVGKSQSIFKRIGTACTVEDAGSPAGTWINDRQVRQPSPLKRGDKLKLGGVVFLVRSAP